MTKLPRSPGTQRGMALVMVMLLTVGVAALAAAAIFLSSGASIVSRGQEREEDMRNAADAGIELGRSALNGMPALFPDTGYATLQLNQQVTDASGNVIPGVTRSIYFGPTGSSTGQYGVFGSVISVIQDRTGAVVVRRGELAQESFARFAYYSNSEASGTICFGGGDQIFGPLHTNDNMCIYSSGARFRSEVEVAGTISGKPYGTFDQGYIERGAVIPLPTVAALSKLNTYATQGGMSFTAPTGGTVFQARMRIEFVAIDLDGDGRVTGPTEGFFRVYQNTGTASPDYVTATPPTNSYANLNCTDGHTVTGGTAPANPSPVYYSSAWHLALTSSPGAWFTSGVTGHTSVTSPSTYTTAQKQGNATASVQQAASRCWLGGDEHLFVLDSAGGFRPRNTFRASDAYGGWLRYATSPDPSVVAGLKNAASGTVDTTLVARTLLAQYLWPLSRQFNPNSKGVIYVTGKVVLSGVVNGKVTVASSDNLIIGDDLKYAIAPGAAPCLASNMLGLLTPGYIYLANNELNAPEKWGTSSSWKSYAATNDEYIQGVLLTLNSFQVEAYDNYASGPTSQQPCGTTPVGRGCLSLTGGLIQRVRGAVGTSAGSGYTKRYAYDACAFQTPPPYFPTTGRFKRNRYYEIDPVGFSVSAFFHSLTPN